MKKDHEIKVINNQKDIDYIFSLTREDVTLEVLKDLFAFKASTNSARFNPSDILKLPANKLYNEKAMNTTVGRYIFNLFILTEKLGPLIGYTNDPMDGKGYSTLEKKMSKILLDDKIDVTDFSEYIDKMQWLGFAISDFINPPLTTNLLMASDRVKARKKELIEKNKEAIERKDVVAVSNIEKELLNMAKDELKDLPDMAIYDSGSRGSFGNNYKMTAIGRGVVPSVSNPSEINISMASLEDGVPHDERYIYADILTNASYSRAIGTRSGGYEAKKLASSLQGIILDEKDSDCRTKHTIRMEINNANKNLLQDRYIMENGKAKLIDDSNIESYVGKIVELRSPMYCNGEKYCNKCAGELYYKLGIKTVGLVANVVGTSVTNLALKAFHNSAVKLKEIDINDYIE